MPQTGPRQLDPKLPWRLLSDGVLFKRATASKHMLRKRRGWAVDTSLLNRARSMGAHLVRIEDEETGATWEASIETFDRHGYSFDHGWGNQTALDIHHWQRQGAAALQDEPARPVTSMQPSLFNA